MTVVRERSETQIEIEQEEGYRLNLRRAYLLGAQMLGSNLTCAILIDANLTRAVLEDANLTRAVLIEADLTRANLHGTNLTGAFLMNAGSDLR